VYREEDNSVQFVPTPQANFHESGKQAFKRMIMQYNNGYIFNKMIKRELVDENEYKKTFSLFHGEDTLF
jgi:hypothetical protein